MTRVAGAPATRPPRTLVALCPDWAAVAAASVAGFLGDQGDAPPVAVVERQRVVAALPAARAAGVRPGQRRREAEAHCPALVVLGRDLGAEVRVFEPAVRSLELLGVPVTVRRPGWASIPTRGPARRHGGEEGLVAAVANLLEQAGQGCAGAGIGWRLGVADGPFTATAAARRGIIVPPGEAAAFLAPLPVELLGDPELADLLRRLGIGRLGDLAALDEGAVLARFGAAGGRAHRLAQGRETAAFPSRRPPPELAVARVLDPPAGRLEEVVLVARALAEELAAGLARRGLSATLTRVEAETVDGERLARCWSDERSAGAGLLAERLRWQLDAWLAARAPEEDARGGREIAVVRLVPLEAVPAGGRQLDLWARVAGTAHRKERTERVLARVQGMLGAAAVLRPVAAGGRSPAEQVRLVPVGDPLPKSDTDASAPWPGRLPAPSPAIVPTEPPLALLSDTDGRPVAVSGRGELSGAPATLAVSGRHRTVVAWNGPFPLDERWWDRHRHRRRVRLQVLAAGGEGYLLSFERGRWVVEGRYD